MPDLGRTLVLLGGGLALAGLVVMLVPQIPWLGRLPGDVVVEREGWSVHVPIVTCLVVSVVLTVLLNLFFRN